MPARRFFSSSLSNENNTLEGLTSQVLNRTSTPLGTMSFGLWEETMDACHQWLRNTKTTAYGINSAHQLLERLQYEHAAVTGSTVGASRQHHTNSIADLQVEVMNAWLSLLSSLSTTTRASWAVLKRANVVLTNMIVWHERGLSLHDPFPVALALIQQCLQHHATTMAVELLLDWIRRIPNVKDSERTQQVVVPLMNVALEQCIEQNLHMTGMALLERMEVLEREYEWQNLHISDDIREQLLSSETAAGESSVAVSPQQQEKESTAAAARQQLSDFETQAMEERFVEFLQHASITDRPKVMEMVGQLALFRPSDRAAQLYKSFFDYFIRIQDARHATLMLSSMDDDLGGGQVNDDNDNIMTEEMFQSVLNLWATTTMKQQSDDDDDDKDAESPWRAQEIVTRMEELERRGRLPHVATSTYNLLLQSWANSADPAVPQKVEDVVSRMVTATQKGVTWKAPNLETYAIYLSVCPTNDKNTIVQIVSEITNRLNELGNEELSTIVERSLEALAMAATPNTSSYDRKDADSIASKLFHHAVSQDIQVTPTMCLNFIRALSSSSTVLREVTYLENLSNVTVPLECYEAAILAVLDARGPSFQEKKNVVSKVLRGYAEGSVSASSSEMEMLMVRIMQELKYQGRPSPIDAMLRLFENFCRSDEVFLKGVRVPVQCFNIALASWSEDGDLNKVEETFKRQMSYFDGGHVSLQPTTASFSALLRVLLLRKDQAQDVAEKATDALERLIQIYESTANIECRPDHFCFSSVLTILSKVQSQKASSKALRFLNQMKTMGIRPHTSDFNKVMHTLLWDQASSFEGAGKFRQILSLMKQLEEAGCEPDLLSYKNLLRACRSPKRGDEGLALNVALDTIGRLRKAGTVDAGSYGLLASALRAILPKDSAKRDQVLSTACRLCYEDGLLTGVNAEIFRFGMRRAVWKRVSATLAKLKAQRAKEDEQTGSEALLQ